VNLKYVDDDAYRTRFLDDLVVGEAFESGWVSITSEEIIGFAQEFDRQYFHSDADAAAASPFGGLIASGAHTFALWNRVNLDMNGDIAWIAGLGFEDFRFPLPLRPDVEIKATSELLSVRPSASKPDRGVVQHRCQLVDRSGGVVFTSLCNAIVHRR
jgi:acyl dehydratase